MEDNKNTKDLFDDSDLSVRFANVEVGQTYPIYGMITSFVRETLGDVVVLINHNIEVSVTIDDAEKLSLLKTKSFEPGIFVCKINTTEPVVTATCSTIVFGKTTQTSEVH